MSRCTKVAAMLVLFSSVGSQCASAQTPAQMEYERQQREYRQQQERRRQEQQRQQQIMQDKRPAAAEEMNDGGLITLSITIARWFARALLRAED